MHQLDPSLLLVVADGVRADVLRSALADGTMPVLAERTARGGHVADITTCFPSVTGVAYTPFLMGRHPARVGLPGIRWYDRKRTGVRRPPYARSYVGAEIHRLNHDLDRDAPTLLELATPNIAGATLLGRGAEEHPGRGISWMMRAVLPHIRGDLTGWRRMEQQVADRVLQRLKASRRGETRPRAAVMTFLTPDKIAHRSGPFDPGVRSALRDVDNFIGEAADIARRNRWHDQQHIWLITDHGHADVAHHDDIADVLRTHGYRVLAHPMVFVRNPDVAVMVSGNAMAHVYLEPRVRERWWWPALRDRWHDLHDALLSRDSVDLIAVATDAHTVLVQRDSGSAYVQHHPDTSRWSYQCVDGDPLGLGGSRHHLSADDAHEVCMPTDYPDALVQLATLVPSERAGDLVLSATPGFDFRERFEPTLHASSHGALHRDQMLVPLVVDHQPVRTPRRTTDVLPSALTTLGIPHPPQLDGRCWRTP